MTIGNRNKIDGLRDALEISSITGLTIVNQDRGHMEALQQKQGLGIEDRLRRSRGRSGRVVPATAKVSRDEHQELEAAAKREGKALSEWAREVLLDKARTGPNGAAIFTELIALRLLANNVLRTLALGRTMTEAEFAQVLSETKSNKHAAATDVLAQYQHRNGEQQ